MNEELKKLFEGAEGFKPEFLTQMANLVESKVSEARVATLREAEEKFDAELLSVKESHKAEITTIKESHMEEMVAKLDGFLNAAVLEWANENAPAIDSKLKVEMAEKLIVGVTSLLGESQIAVIGDADGVVADLQEKLQIESQARVVAENKLQEINEAINLAERNEVIARVCEGLADTQKETVIGLTEGVAFTDKEAFASRVQRYRNLVEGKKPDEKDGKDTDTKDDKDDKGKKDKDDAGSEVNESVAAQIRATLALRG